MNIRHGAHSLTWNVLSLLPHNPIVPLIVDLVPLTLEARAAYFVRVTLRQPETEQRLHWLLGSVFRVLVVHFPDLVLQVEHKEYTHACYRIWSGQVSTRAGVKMVKRVAPEAKSVGTCGRRRRDGALHRIDSTMP